MGSPSDSWLARSDICGVPPIGERAPLVFWDGYGLGSAPSGILTHARLMVQSLGNIGVHPILLAPQTGSLLEPFMDVVTVPSHWGGHRWGGLKFVWPESAGGFLRRELGAWHRPVIMHGLSNFNVPVRGRAPFLRKVLTVHDIIPLIAPRGVSPAYRAQFGYLLPRAAQAADSIVCVSEWTRNSLLQRWPKWEAKCVVIPNGIATPLAPREAASQRTATEPTEARPVLLYVSRMEGYKRLDFLVNVVRFLPESWILRIVTDHAGQKVLRRVGQRLLEAGRLDIRAGSTPDLLKSMYQEATVYAQPSLYEGFCLPAVEALGQGCPVAFTSGSAVQEIMDESVAIGLEPTDQGKRWAEAVLTLAARRKAEDWLERIYKHLLTLKTWDDAAIRLKKLYNDLS